ncbi:unnamed protein product [Caenorhabditis nigoni]
MVRFQISELNAACTQKYMKGNFLPTILCFNEYPDARRFIKKCVESNEGQNLMKNARKALPIANRTPNGFIMIIILINYQQESHTFNKAPKEQLCGLKSLKSQEACQPFRHS